MHLGKQYEQCENHGPIVNKKKNVKMKKGKANYI